MPSRADHGGVDRLAVLSDRDDRSHALDWEIDVADLLVHLLQHDAALEGDVFEPGSNARVFGLWQGIQDRVDPRVVTVKAAG
jgi:hypothetical protein